MDIFLQSVKTHASMENIAVFLFVIIVLAVVLFMVFFTDFSPQAIGGIALIGAIVFGLIIQAAKKTEEK